VVLHFAPQKTSPLPDQFHQLLLPDEPDVSQFDELPKQQGQPFAWPLSLDSILASARQFFLFTKTTEEAGNNPAIASS
jgi:hypothetical protein